MNASQQLVRELYAAFATGDLPGLLGRFADDMTWNEAEGFPYADGNPYVGGEAIVAGVFARLGDDWEGFRVEVGEVVGGPEVVVMLGRYKGTDTKTGKPLDVQCSHTWWIADGKVTRFQQMVDTLGVRTAATA